MHLYQRGATWWLRFTDHTGRVRRLRGAKQKRNAELIARNVATLVDNAAAGAAVPDDLAEWLHSIDAPRRERLQEWGLVSAARMVAGDGLETPLERWRQSILNHGRREDYADKRHLCAKRLFEAAGFAYFRDIHPEAVLETIARWRKAKKLPGEWKRHSTVSENTLSHHVSAAKSFTRWMYRNGYAPRDPLLSLPTSRRKPGPEATLSRQAQRRALTEDEQANLIRKTAAGESKVYGVPASERAALYRVALATGLRQRFIRGLKVADVDYAHAVIQAEGEGNKRASPKPMPAHLADALRPFTEGRDSAAPLFTLPSEHNMARMLRRDAEAAGIPAEKLDFHALRHTFGTTLARKGVHPKTLMRLMDHQDINITMRYYTHAFPEDEWAAVAQLPAMVDAPDPEQEREAG